MIRKALHPFGAEVRGIKIDAAPTIPASDLIDLISRHRIVVFKGQSVDDNGFVRFLKALGELTFTEGETPVAGAPDLNIVSNVGRTKPPRSVFHTDTSYVERPPAFTALRPVLLPRMGGATLFSDQVAAAARLPATVRERLQGRTMRHRTTGLDGRDESTRHPILRRHPVTGEVALFLSTPERCSDVSGLDPETSLRVVNALYRHSIRPSRLYRHAWSANDVVVWDDRATMHRADHHAVDGDRMLHRGMVMGEVPIAA